MVYQDTLDRLEELQKTGKRVVVIWEHEFRKMIKEDKNVKAFVDALTFPKPLDP